MDSETTLHADASVPPSVLAKAKKEYLDELNRAKSDRQTFDDVDFYKDDLRYFADGRIVNLSDDAKELLAGHALFVGAIPADLEVRGIAEDTLAYWKAEWGIDIPLAGPTLSNIELIARKDQAGNVIDGWLDMTARDPGRPALTGRNQLSVKALCRVIEILAPYCCHVINGRNDSSRASAAAKFIHKYVVSFEPKAEIKDINYVLYSRFGKNR